LSRLEKISFAEKLRSEHSTQTPLPGAEHQLTRAKDLSAEARKQLRKARANQLNEQRHYWIESMIKSEDIIHEKMNLFWHHHFACEIKNGVYAAQFSNTIRRHAIGNFGMLVKEVAQSAAMMGYLNVRKSKKEEPNEDFARELCELFLLGQGNGYTEFDVKEIARAFTGWRHKADGTFFLNKFQHDHGQKTIFGQTGNFDGLDVIDLILAKKECATFIATNVYTYFVNPTADQAHVLELANVLRSNNYEIAPLLLHIAEADWLYEAQNVLARIKSPIELLVGMAKQLNLKSSNIGWAWALRVLDQELYKPQNVKGWKQDKEWINSNSLTTRLSIPSLLLSQGQFDLPARPDYDSDPKDGGRAGQLNKKVRFDHDWSYFLEQHKNTDLRILFFNGQLSDQAKQFLAERQFDSKKEELVQLMSLPEFQLF